MIVRGPTLFGMQTTIWRAQGSGARSALIAPDMVRRKREIDLLLTPALWFNLLDMNLALPEIVWRLDEITERDPDRAASLAKLTSPDQLMIRMVTAFTDAVEDGASRFGWEACGQNERDHRAVLQFDVGEALFDGFFNAIGGYRAQYRIGLDEGLRFNEQLVAAIVEVLRDRLPSKVAVTLLDHPNFDAIGMDHIERAEFLHSLGGDPHLSKLWFCGRLLEPDVTVRDLMPGFNGPKIQLENGTRWAALESSSDGAWLDMKGAFLGRNGLYQTKDPEKRGRTIGSFGEA